MANQKSDECNLKVKGRNKPRKSPYQTHIVANNSLPSKHQTTPTNVPISPVWPPIGGNKWQQQHHNNTSKPLTNNHSPYFSNKTPHILQERSPGGGSNSSCHGDNSTGHHTPHREISPITREHLSSSSCYWTARNNCLFGSFDSVQHTPEELYKAAYGSYYQQLAASAARTYTHIPTGPNKLTNLYYTNPYSRFAGSYANHLAGGPS